MAHIPAVQSWKSDYQSALLDQTKAKLNIAIRSCLSARPSLDLFASEHSAITTALNDLFLLRSLNYRYSARLSVNWTSTRSSVRS